MYIVKVRISKYKNKNRAIQEEADGNKSFKTLLFLAVGIIIAGFNMKQYSQQLRFDNSRQVNLEDKI